jgi:4-diphosphocytidyl-2-C-methyl-D-erythritol kinase
VEGGQTRQRHGGGRRVVVRTPAKINLFLAVRGMRPDGYHDLVTILQTVSVRDEVASHIEGPPGRSHHPAGRRHMHLRLELDETVGVPSGDGNLVTRAARLLGRRVGVLSPHDSELAVPSDAAPSTVLTLDKRIPVAGGMAGGSSDAAATLVALNRLWDCGLSVDELTGLAADLGSDVPFCVVGGTALATGRGTEVARVLCRGTFHWVVGVSSEPLSTPEVYRAWDRCCRPSEVEPDLVLTALSTGDAEALGAALTNDLQPAAFTIRPRLAAQRQALLDAGALGAVLSGSGPTMLGLARDAADAMRLAETVRAHFDRVEVASSPAGGPEVCR